jgi:hypothetical protein
MEQQSFRAQLVEWLKEIIPYNRLDDYVLQIETNPDHINYTIYTATHSYSISAKPTYLGCIASATFCRPGEDWTRGNDLPDGKFCRETWENIKDAIIRYELVKLAPVAMKIIHHQPINENGVIPIEGMK